MERVSSYHLNIGVKQTPFRSTSKGVNVLIKCNAKDANNGISGFSENIQSSCSIRAQSSEYNSPLVAAVEVMPSDPQYRNPSMGGISTEGINGVLEHANSVRVGNINDFRKTSNVIYNPSLTSIRVHDVIANPMKTKMPYSLCTGQSNVNTEYVYNIQYRKNRIQL
jgi:hypothetical protein